MPFISYAQNLEDVVLHRALGDIKDGFYVDVGANDPVIDSVTKAFYDLGWSGVNIEPDQNYFHKLAADRPRDANINCAISSTHQMLEFYVIPETGLSTGDLEIATTHQKAGWTIQKSNVAAYPLKDILKPYEGKEIHFLKIDVEGMEREVLQGMDWKQNRPWIIVIETTAPLTKTPTHQKWESIILNAKYKYAYFDGLNRYYLADEHSDLLEKLQYPPGVFDDFAKHKDLVAQEKLKGELEQKVREADTRRIAAEESLNTATVSLRHAEARVNELNEQVKQAEHTHTATSQTLESIRTEAAQLQAQYAQEQQHSRQLESKNAELSVESKILKQTMAEAQTERASAMAALRTAETRVIELTEQAKQAGNAHAATLATLDDIKNEVARLHAQYAQEQQHSRQLEIKNAELSVEVKIHRQSIANVQAERASAMADLRTAEKRIIELTVQEKQAEHTHAATLNAIASLRNESAQLRTQYAQEQQHKKTLLEDIEKAGKRIEQMQVESLVKDQSIHAKDITIKHHEDEHKKQASEIERHLHESRESTRQLQSEIIRLDAEIKRLRTLLYATPAGTHLYRALRVFLGDRHYRQAASAPVAPSASAKPLKKYTNLKVPWHTHLYRAGLGIFVKGEKPWHTHVYRAWKAIFPEANISTKKIAKGKIDQREISNGLIRTYIETEDVKGV